MLPTRVTSLLNWRFLEMKVRTIAGRLAVIFFAAGFLAWTGGGLEAEDAKKNAAGVPEKASDLYPNDFGPAEIDVSAYPKPMRDAYKLFAFKCAACHTIARPINSQFLELSHEEAEDLEKKDPAMFKDKKVVYVEDKIWNRYVKRMMTKPGCPVKGEDGKKIWEFLVYDSKMRKTGANAKAWREHRGKLVHDFKAKYPQGYSKLFGGQEEPVEAKSDKDRSKEKHERHEHDEKSN